MVPLCLCCSMAAAEEPTKVAVSSIMSEDAYREAPYEPYPEKEYYPEPKYPEYEKKDHYGKADKVSVKLYEKFRSSLRPQPGNEHTFQFT